MTNQQSPSEKPDDLEALEKLASLYKELADAKLGKGPKKIYKLIPPVKFTDE